MKEEHCDSCGIIEGGDECHEVFIKYRGQNICDWCKFNWRDLEEDLGRTITFDTFIEGVELKVRKHLDMKNRAKTGF